MNVQNCIGGCAALRERGDLHAKNFDGRMGWIVSNKEFCMRREGDGILPFSK